MADDRIILLKESDIISDSMHKINYNFQLLDQDSKVNDYKWQQYVNSIDKKFDGFKNNFDSRENAMAQNLADIQDLIDSMATKEDIQNQINNAIQNANEELNGFISQVVGQQVGQALGGYATTSYVQNAIGGLDLDYVRTSAFNSYKANAEERTADATMMAANSTFAKDGGKLVFADGSVSSFRTIEEYWNSLSDAAKAQINSNYGRGLNDPDVLQSFITHCESKFRSVSTELALVKTSVVDGGASFDIMAAVNNEDTGKAITSAIFGWANQQGSGIILTADHVQIEGDFAGVHARDILWDADDRLALVAGQLIFNADNFVLTKDGNIYANNAELNNVRLNGDITAKTFKTNSGKTTIGADGILHAEGAIISGKIKANEFEAIATESINNNGVSGNLTKTTTITGSDFQMSSQGELTTPNGTFNTDGNSLYMKIVDAIPNSGNNDIPETVLYGVPALCMRYKGIEYILSPASWYRPGSSSQDTSNMRFIRRYSGIQCKFNGATTTALSNYCIKTNSFSLGSGLTSTVYIFRPENDPHPTIGGNTFLTIGSGDSVFQFSILNWGDNDHNTTVNMINSVTPKLINSYSGGDTVDGAYTLGSVLGQDGLRFANANGVQTVINSNNRNTMKGYLPTSDYSIGVEMFKETPDTPYTTLPTAWGLSRIATFINSLLKGNAGHATGNGIWVSNVFSNRTSDVLFTGSGGDNGSALDGHLPFEDSTNQSNYFYYKVDYWPLSTITNNGGTHSSGTKQIVIKYQAHIRSDYDYHSSNKYTDRVLYRGNIPLNEGESDYRDIYFKNIELTVEFYAVIDITSGNISEYNPSSTITHSKIEEKVQYLLENYPFQTEIYDKHVNMYNDFYNYIKLTGNIYAADITNNEDILISYNDRY